MQPAEGAEAGRSLGRQDIDHPPAGLVALVGGHLGQQPVDRAIGDLALAPTAVVVEADQPGPEQAFVGAGAGALKAVGIGQGQAVPGHRLDGILQVLVAGPLAFVALGQLKLGEEVAAEGLAAQVADVALLLVELGLRLARRGGPGAGLRGRMRPSPEQRRPEGPSGDASPDQQQQSDSHQDDQKQGRTGIVVVAVTPAAPFGTGSWHRDKWRRVRRRRRSIRRLAVLRVHQLPQDMAR